MFLLHFGHSSSQNALPNVSVFGRVKCPLEIKAPEEPPKAAKTCPNIPEPASETRPNILEPASETHPCITDPASETHPSITDPASETHPSITDPASETHPKFLDPSAREFTPFLPKPNPVTLECEGSGGLLCVLGFCFLLSPMALLIVAHS
jgi:hypothetical protein